jgi:DNA-binding beta-propeller fold protein YncE
VIRGFGVSIFLGGLLILLPAVATSQNSTPTRNDRQPAVVATPSTTPSQTPSPNIKFVGLYQPDGVFALPNSAAVSKNRDQRGDYARVSEGRRVREVPPFIDLGPKENVVSSFRPPYRAAAPIKGHSLLATFRDRLVLMAYGRQNLLRAPTHLAVDSRQRLIISDPDLNSVHVIDSTGKNAFRIAGGTNHRFSSPDGIAVDANDNIYVVDLHEGMIQVFDPTGNFIRTIGVFHGERRFDKPTAIAINQKQNLLYVLDGTANELVVLDREGNFVEGVGGRSKRNIEFNYPTEIAVTGDRIVVLDDFGARVQVFDTSFTRLSSFRVKVHDRPPVLHEIGLSIDAAGRIYLSDLFPNQIAVYTLEGKLAGLFGHAGSQIQEFKVPSGLWIDPEDHIYVADTDNSRVQVFQSLVRKTALTGRDGGTP